MSLVGPFTRSEKRLIRSKGSLRCQWCYRWTEIQHSYDWASLRVLKKDRKGRKPKPGDSISSFQSWQEYAEVNGDSFRCSRETCVAERRAAM